MNLVKEMIDKQNTLILETNRIRYFIKTNQLITGTYSLGDKSSDLKKSTTKSREMNSDLQTICHQSQYPAFTNPTILMYTIIKNKSIFLKPLLHIYLEIYPKKYKHIVNQKSLNKKINILNLSIESNSNECFDIILNFFHKYKIEYNLRNKIEFSAIYNNCYTLGKFFEEDQKLYQEIKRIVIGNVGEEDKNKASSERKVENQKKETNIMNKILIEIKKSSLNDILNEKDSTTIEDTPISSIFEIDNQEPPDKCSYEDCPNDISEKCILCDKWFCDEHSSHSIHSH